MRDVLSDFLHCWMIVLQVLAGLRLLGVHPTHLLGQKVPDLLVAVGLDLVPFGVQALLQVSRGDLPIREPLEETLVVRFRRDVAFFHTFIEVDTRPRHRGHGTRYGEDLAALAAHVSTAGDLIDEAFVHGLLHMRKQVCD